MGRAIWCTAVLASGCGISVIGTDPGSVDIASQPDGSVSTTDSGNAVKDGATSSTNDDGHVDTDPEDATTSHEDAGTQQPTFKCNDTTCEQKCCVETGKLTCEAQCKDWEIGCRTSTECGDGRVCCFDTQRRSRCASSCAASGSFQRVCVPQQNDCPGGSSCIQATCYDTPAPFGTCQRNDQSGQVIINNCRFRG